MPVTINEYANWIYDSSRNPYRVYLLDIAYADNNTEAGHGRDNFSALLNPVKNLRVETYAAGVVDILFAQPTQQEGYSWEVWIDGEPEHTTQSGSYNMTGAQSGTTYQVVVCSVDAQLRYSIPHTVTFTYDGTEQDIDGAAGDWNDIGGGTGGDGTGSIRVSWPHDFYAGNGILYHDLITSTLYIEDSLKNFDGIGDIRILNMIPGVDFDNVYWRGHKATLRHGDMEWPVDDFLPIYQTLVDGVEKRDSEEYQFNLMDKGTEFRTLYTDDEEVYSGDVFNLISYVTGKPGMKSHTFTGFPSSAYYSCDYELNENVSQEQIMRDIAESLNGDVIISRFGFDGRILKFTNAVQEVFTEDNIFIKSVRPTGSIPAAKRVVMNLGGSSGTLKAVTTAKTGELTDTVTINSILTNRDQAENILAEYVNEYSRTRQIKELELYSLAGFVYVGYTYRFDHPEIQGDYVCLSLDYTPFENSVKMQVIERHDAGSLPTTISMEWV